MKRVKNNNNSRNSGIDFLRILSSFFIIMLHIMCHGGIRDALHPGDINFYVFWFVMMVSFGGVNCFALISGYVGYHETEKPHKSARFIDLWFEVVFYCIITVAIFKILKMPDIGIRDFVEAFFPITFERYWFFSGYLGVFVFMPLLNKCIREFSSAWLATMTVVGVGAFSFFATIFTRYSDPFLLNGGYGMVWLIFLYFIGAVVKKYRIADKVTTNTLALIIAACGVITWAWKVFLISTVGHGVDDLLVIYISPTILLMSVCQLLLFSKLKFNSFMTKLIAIMAPTVFGIYLFQDSDYFRAYIVSGSYAGYARKTPLMMVGLILLTSLIQFLMGFVIDKCRAVLFNAIKIKNLSNRIGDVFDDGVNRTIKFVEERLN